MIQWRSTMWKNESLNKKWIWILICKLWKTANEVCDWERKNKRFSVKWLYEFISCYETYCRI
jgi:hypothetical protein